MADIRCPMCSKSNPEKAEVCQFCGARIKPLIVSSDKTPEPPKLPPPESSLPDWLADLRGPKDESDFNREPENASFDWSPDEKSPLEPASPTPASVSGSEMPDWLARIRKRSNEEGNSREPESPSQPAAFRSSPGKDQPDESQAAPGGSEETDLPDWLASLGASGTFNESAAPEEQKTDSSAAEPVEEEPDWLQRIRTRQQKEEGEPPLGVFTGEPAPEPESSEDTDIPDWLASIHEPAGANAPFPEEPAAQPADLPEWLPKPESPATGEPVVEPFAAEPEAEPEAPDWLAKLNGQEVEGLPTLYEPDQKEPAEELPSGLPAGDQIPDWLAKLDSGAADKTPGAGVPALILDDESEVPQASQADETAGLEAADLNQLPEWISQVSAEDNGAAAPRPAEAESGSSLAPAQLPSWLEAMRPVESPASAVSPMGDLSAAVERAGPLAGLRGVLPGDASITRLRKPAHFSIKLQIPEDEQTLVKRLEEMLATESVARPQAARQTISSQSLLRMFVAIVLFLSILAPMLYDRMYLNQKLLPLPVQERITPEIIDTNVQVGSLRVGAPVLLAFDYEPGFSAEIESASAAILDQLISRGAYLTLVSTSPTGPVLGERLMANINSKRASPYTNYTNLGYIPGGATGLVGFAERPRQVMPYNLRSQDPWGSGPLAGFEKVSNFSMVMVFTENADTARNWIEQVQPYLAAERRPLIMVVSAQVEPLVRPYYEATPRQVNGMIAGIAGGAAYESLIGRPGLARDDWDAFGGGLMAAGILIFAGMLIYGGMAVVASAKQSKQTEGKAAL